MAHATPAEYRKRFEIQGAAGYYADSAISPVLAQASTEADLMAKRSFALGNTETVTIPVTANEARTGVVYVGDWAEITGVTLNGVADTGFSYQRLEGKPDIFPFEYVVKADGFAADAALAITGKRGWAAVPEAVKNYVLYRTAWLRAEGPLVGRDDGDNRSAISMSMMRKSVRDYGRVLRP